MAEDTSSCSRGKHRRDDDADACKDLHECSDCRKSLPHIRHVFKSEKHVLSMHVEYWILGQSGKKGHPNTVQKVRSFTDEFFKKVCSLRNSKGGVLAIHVQKMDENCGPSLDHFDEKVSKDLSNMIEDDSPYTYNYQRHWFEQPEDSDDQPEAKYIIVIVKGSSAVSTKHFNTLVPFDGSKERPRAREVAKFFIDDLQCGMSNEKRDEKNFKEGERIDFIESRSVQFKSLSQRDLDNDASEKSELESKSLSERIVFRLTEKLGLLQYITAFTKLTEGGSFFLGIEEEKKKVPMTPKSPSSKTKTLNPMSRRELHFDFQGQTPRQRCSGKPGHFSVHYRSDTETRKAEDRSRDFQRYQGHSGRSRSRSRRSDSNDSRRDDRHERVSPRRQIHEGHSLRSSRRDKQPDERSRERSSRCTQKRSSERESRESSRDRGKQKISRSPPRPNLQLTHLDKRQGSSTSRTSSNRPPCTLRTTPRKPDKTESTRSPSSVPGTPGTPGAKEKEIRTGHNVVRGFKISKSERTGIKSLLGKKISDSMMWLKSNGESVEIRDILHKIDFIFHDCTSDSESKCVFEIQVKQVFQGLVFFTRLGPEAYRLGDEGIITIPVEDWMKLLKRTTQCASCIRSENISDSEN